jgi:UDP-N-acetylglucosamine/UDP-N-acetylgalactosamine diphosphorylase
MRTLLAAKEEDAGPAEFEPAPVVHLDGAERERALAEGERLLRAGTVGVIVVAGGQGSRLGFEGPKGAYPIGPITEAPLFEIHAHKVLALERRYDTSVPLYVMTSPANDRDTRAFFRENGFFGLSPDRVVFFAQGMWPAVWSDGRVVLDRADHIFMSPDGHGGILRAMDVSGAFADMEQRGLGTLFYFQVDNPLVEIADPAFIGLHSLRRAEASTKVCAKRDPEEGLGVVVDRGGRNAIVEYTELTSEQKHATDQNGELRFRYGSVAIHVFSLAFLRQEAARDLPLHVAHKKVPYCGADGETITPEEPNAYKFEKFIFDVLPDAERALNVVFDRAEEFSPVKNAEGSDSPATARRDMMRKFARRLDACGVSVPRDDDGVPAVKIEIDPCYALDAGALRERLGPELTVRDDLLLRA